jgi:RNA polymerase sigma factor (sigma-70 family)
MSDSKRPSPADLEREVVEARAGSRRSLERVVAAIQDQVYGLALRFLWDPDDAADASQEVMIRVITGLSGFRGESRFRTWVHRVAVTTLLNFRRGRMEAEGLTFSAFGADLEEGGSGVPFAPPPDVDHDLLLEEVRIGCTLGMLLCLERPARIAYILGDILDLDHREAAAVLQVTPAAFRKRLSRARQRIVDFTRSHCGLVNADNACRCDRRLPVAIERGRVDPDRLRHASDAERARAFPVVLRSIRRLEEARRTVALYRAQSAPEAPPRLTEVVREVLAAGGAMPGG